MPILYIMVGVPGSGKTTFAKKLATARDAIHISSDAIRKALTGDENNQTANKLVFPMMHTGIRVALKNGHNVIADATNITERNRYMLVMQAAGTMARVVFVVMDTPFSECLERNWNRDRVVPDYAMKRMIDEYTIPTANEGGLVVFANNYVTDDIP